MATLVVGILATAAGCSAASEDDSNSSANDLTSITARSRKLEFAGTVYVDANATDDDIMQAVRAQAQTGFGPLRTANIAVNSRELHEIDASKFQKRAVKEIDTSVPNDPGTDKLEIHYTYTDDAVVDVKYADRSAVPLVLMSPGYQSQTDRIMTECTANDSEAEEFRSDLWYVFDPSLEQCQEAVKKESDAIEADRRKLTDPTHQVAKSDVERLYLPIEVQLGADKTNQGQSWPEYQRLYSGGVKADKLVISLVYGLLDDDNTNGPAEDSNWSEFMTNLAEVVDAQPGFHVVSGPDDVDLSSFTLSDGTKVDAPSIEELVHAHEGGDQGLSYGQQQDLDTQFANRIFRKRVTIERPVTVKIGDEPEKNFAVQLLVYFGSQSDSGPHKYAVKNSDVFLYNGHSYIGYGPLDPSNFEASDFPSSYQIFWIDGCVSYNYYEKDYIPLKSGGTKNLDLITNGIEAPAYQSGHAMAQFLIRLLDGKNASYRDLLDAARDTDPLRVVDGELDNVFSPDKFPIVVSSR